MQDTSSSSVYVGKKYSNWKDYLSHPRICITLILCTVVFVTHVGYGLYVWLA